MTNINEEYVTFETAKLLKEAGFPQDGYLTYYNENGTTLHSQMPCAERFSRCTKYQAMRWLRERHEWPLDIVSVPNKMTVDKKGIGHGSDYEYVVVHTTLPYFKSYEAAAEAGIQDACKYLIEKGGEE